MSPEMQTNKGSLYGRFVIKYPFKFTNPTTGQVESMGEDRISREGI
jgi:hypothetical protein